MSQWYPAWFSRTVEVKILKYQLTKWWRTRYQFLCFTGLIGFLGWTRHLFFVVLDEVVSLILILDQWDQENQADKSELAKWFDNKKLDKDTGKVVVRYQ